MRSRRWIFAAFFASFSVAAACSASKEGQQGTVNLKDAGGADGSVTPEDGGGGGGLEVGGLDSAPLWDGSGDAKLQPMRIVPTDATLMLVGGKDAVREYTLQLQNGDGTETDITAEATWYLVDATLGTFAGNKLTATKEGKTMVRASARGMTVETPLTVRGPVTIVTGGAPADAATRFGGAVDAARAPKLLYPNDGTIVPPNMNVLEFHFDPGAGNTLFELAFAGAGIDVKVYLGCTAVGGGCVYSPDAAVWKYVADNARGGEPVTYTLRGVDGAAPGKVGASTPQKLSFGQEDILGGIYYWSAATGAVMRYEFGVSGKAGEVYLSKPMAGAAFCVGCHVLSRNGARISAGLDIPGPSPYKVFDVATRATIFAQGTTFAGGSNFFTFSPDATQMVTSNGYTLVLRDAKTGAALVNPLANPGAQADWSPDGKRLVYARPTGTLGPTGVNAASLELMQVDGGGKWSALKSLVPFGGQNNYYPAYSPDGSLVVFNRSPSNASSYDAPDAEVWMVGADGGAPFKLARASTGGDSWPKWTPVLQKYRSGNLLWVTFSSRRAYGLRTPGGKDSPAQIWMTAIDLAKAKAGVDASYPAFWLPFQDVKTGNHIAQWVTKVERMPCSKAAECLSGEQCIGGTCRPVIK